MLCKYFQQQTIDIYPYLSIYPYVCNYAHTQTLYYATCRYYVSKIKKYTYTQCQWIIGVIDGLTFETVVTPPATS